jgi:hypothetical protein
MSKRYLGDSVYADFDGYHVMLTTENGYGPSNSICLEPQVIEALNEYVRFLRSPRTRTVGLGHPEQPPDYVNEPDRSDEANDEI